MISHLRGTVHKLSPGEATVDVQGVGYRVSLPITEWDGLEEGVQRMLWISTYIREDRFELFGFGDRAGRTLFEELLKRQGIGPKLALELCAVPRGLLLQSVHEQDPTLLTGIKGVGKKTAEKVLLELKSLLEKEPNLFGTHEKGTPVPSAFDQDAIAALSQLGYDAMTIQRVLKELPPEVKTTEERVATALRRL